MDHSQSPLVHSMTSVSDPSPHPPSTGHVRVRVATPSPHTVEQSENWDQLDHSWVTGGASVVPGSGVGSTGSHLENSFSAVGSNGTNPLLPFGFETFLNYFFINILN